MMTGTSRERQVAALWLAMGIAGCVLASPARADVLEVSVGGSSWVVGGPPPSALPAPPAEAVPYEQAPGGRPVAVTQARTTAGPPQWQAHVAYLSQKYDVSPALIEALVWQESRWRPGARSHAGASGLTQLMPGTARELGVNPWDPFANLEGGVRYLRQQLDRFDGDIEKALAAYNAGPGRVLRAGGVPNIRETRGYVASIMSRLASPVRR